MNKGQYVFSQLVSHLDRNHFNYLARKYDGNKYVKHFSCWNQLLAMMFGQLSNRESLRDLIVAFEAHRAKQYHLGLGREPIAKTTLASENQNRDYRIIEDFAFYMMKEACEKRTTNILDIPGKKYAFDSTTIPLCLATFPWAKFRRKKGGIKAHVLYDIEAQVPAFYTVTQHLCMILRQCLQFPVSQMLTTYSIGLTTHSGNSTEYTLQSLSLLSEPRRT